jgi:hypothetical protein
VDGQPARTGILMAIHPKENWFSSQACRSPSAFPGDLEMFTLRLLTALMVDRRHRSARVNRAFPTLSVEGLEARQLLSVGGPLTAHARRAPVSLTLRARAAEWRLLPTSVASGAHAPQGAAPESSGPRHAVHTGRLPVRSVANQLIVGLERRIQVGPLADLEAGRIGQDSFITEVSKVLDEFEQEVDRRLLLAHPSVAARLKVQVDRIQAALAAQAHQGDEDNLALHIHVYLTILINGRPVIIPANVGITASGAGPVHTHDASGKIHVESEAIRTFRLADFFAAWERAFNRRDILGHRSDTTHQITMTVNGQRSMEFENLILRDGDRIVIRYGPKGRPLG